MKHTLSILVENKPGVLTRVAGLFARRGFNIESLAVGLSEDPRLSRITIVIDGDEHPVDQVTKQLHKLINVLKIRDLQPDNSVSAELLLVRVAADGDKRTDALQIAEIFKAKIVDVDRRALTLRVVGTTDKVEALLEEKAAQSKRLKAKLAPPPPAPEPKPAPKAPLRTITNEMAGASSTQASAPRTQQEAWDRAMAVLKASRGA